MKLYVMHRYAWDTRWPGLNPEECGIDETLMLGDHVLFHYNGYNYHSQHLDMLEREVVLNRILFGVMSGRKDFIHWSEDQPTIYRREDSKRN